MTTATSGVDRRRGGGRGEKGSRHVMMRLEPWVCFFSEQVWQDGRGETWEKRRRRKGGKWHISRRVSSHWYRYVCFFYSYIIFFTFTK